MLNERVSLVEACTLLGDAPADRGLHFRVAIVGGAALLLTGQIARPTQDVDVAAVASEGPLVATWHLPDLLIELRGTSPRRWGSTQTGSTRERWP